MDKSKRRVITPQAVRLMPYLTRVWSYRMLVLKLTKRNLRVKYAQTQLGVLWVVLQPLTGMLIFTLFFSGILNLSEFQIEVPYYLFAYSGFATWIYFVYIVQSAGTSLVQDEALIKKAYFPKLILPISRTLSGLTDYALSLLVLFGMALFGGHLSLSNLIFLPAVVVMTTVVGWAFAFWLSGLTIRYRDFIHLIPYVVNFGIWLSPVFYPTTIIPAKYSFLSYLNPMAGIVDLTRWSILGTPMPNLNVLWSIGGACVLMLVGMIFFVRIEDEIADHV